MIELLNGWLFEVYATQCQPDMGLAQVVVFRLYHWLGLFDINEVTKEGSTLDR